MIRILHIEEDPLDAELVAWELARSDLDVKIQLAVDQAEIIAELTEFEPHVVLSDFNMTGFTGEDVLSLVRKIAPEVPFIFIAAGIGEDRVIQLLKEGATDYVLKGRTARLPATIRRAMAEVRAAERAREMENNLRRSQKMEAVGTLAAGVAHEINNPLTYVLSSLELLRDESMKCLDESGCEQITAAIEGVLRIREIVRNLKTFARSDENDPPGPVDVVQTVERALAMAAPQVRHRARVEAELAPVPDVMGHLGQLGQVILNLVVNASQAMLADNPKNNVIVVRTMNVAGKCVIEVQDNGPGIPAENLERIFDPYFTTKPVDIGTGLGLAICRSIIEGHGGTIEVESVLDSGATFRVRLPAAVGDVIPRMKPRKERTVLRRRLRILVVDDEPGIRRSTCRVLGIAGHETVAAANGAEALRVLEKDSFFDIILSDLHMPEISGQGLYEELMKCKPQLARRVAFMTGGAVLSGPGAFLDTVRNYRIDKPFQTDDLLRLVDSVIWSEEAFGG